LRFQPKVLHLATIATSFYTDIKIVRGDMLEHCY